MGPSPNLSTFYLMIIPYESNFINDVISKDRKLWVPLIFWYPQRCRRLEDSLREIFPDLDNTFAGYKSPLSKSPGSHLRDLNFGSSSTDCSPSRTEPDTPLALKSPSTIKMHKGTPDLNMTPVQLAKRTNTNALRSRSSRITGRRRYRLKASPVTAASSLKKTVSVRAKRRLCVGNDPPARPAKRVPRNEKCSCKKVRCLKL